MRPYNIRDVSCILDISPYTVSMWIRKYDDFPASNTGPYKAFVMDVVELRDWMQKQKKQSIWRKYWLRLDQFIRRDSRHEDFIFGDLLNVKEK